jgi:SAM-dependent methyltransferase
MSQPNAAEAAKLVYGAVNGPVLAAIPATARRVLDVGCGSGALGQALKQRQAVEVVGLTYSDAEAAIARTRLDRVETCDLNAPNVDDLGLFDCIVCSHVLEHLYWPEELLAHLRPHLAPQGVLVVALPNVLAWRQRLAFLCGRFRYTDGGLMDRTHFRFYDWGSAQALVRNAGFRVVAVRAEGVFPILGRLPLLGPALNRLATSLAPGLFGFQFVIVAVVDK